MWDLSTLTGYHTRVPCIGKWILNHYTTRKVPSFKSLVWSPFLSVCLCEFDFSKGSFSPQVDCGSLCPILIPESALTAPLCEFTFGILSRTFAADRLFWLTCDYLANFWEHDELTFIDVYFAPGQKPASSHLNPPNHPIAQ